MLPNSIDTHLRDKNTHNMPKGDRFNCSTAMRVLKPVLRKFGTLEFSANEIPRNQRSKPQVSAVLCLVSIEIYADGIYPEICFTKK